MARKSTMKAISPLIATVLLISFTFTIAAILAGWGQNISKQSLSASEITQRRLEQCGGGTVQYLYTGIQNPMMDGNQIKAQIQVDGVPLGNFTFVAILKNGNTAFLSDTTGTSLAPGTHNIGTIISEPTALAKADISSVMITTNCTDTRTILKPLG
jgi:flagellin-like protein